MNGFGEHNDHDVVHLMFRQNKIGNVERGDRLDATFETCPEDNVTNVEQVEDRTMVHLNLQLRVIDG